MLQIQQLNNFNEMLIILLVLFSSKTYDANGFLTDELILAF